MTLKRLYLLVVLNICSISFALAGTWTTDKYQGIYGARNYKIYVPDTLSSRVKPAIVVMLHGCQQNAADFAKGSRIEKWADKEKFIALFPEQNVAYNSFKCWNWIMPANNARAGEAQVIVEMLDAVIEKYDADKERVYAAGMSAGASMVNILGNCYPERFKALASHDGSQFYSSYMGMDFAEVVLSGANVPASVAGFYGNNCSLFVGQRPKVMPIIIFHGMNSPLMSPIHAFQVETEFKIFNDFLDNGIRDNSYFLEKNVKSVPDTKTYGYTLYTTTNSDKDIFIERYMINNLSHGWSGGVPDLPYNEPKGPDASAMIMKFFKRFGL